METELLQEFLNAYKREIWIQGWFRSKHVEHFRVFNMLHDMTREEYNGSRTIVHDVVSAENNGQA